MKIKKNRVLLLKHLFIQNYYWVSCNIIFPFSAFTFEAILEYYIYIYI